MPLLLTEMDGFLSPVFIVGIDAFFSSLLTHTGTLQGALFITKRKFKYRLVVVVCFFLSLSKQINMFVFLSILFTKFCSGCVCSRLYFSPVRTHSSDCFAFLLLLLLLCVLTWHAWLVFGLDQDYIWAWGRRCNQHRFVFALSYTSIRCFSFPFLDFQKCKCL